MKNELCGNWMPLLTLGKWRFNHRRRHIGLSGNPGQQTNMSILTSKHPAVFHTDFTRSHKEKIANLQCIRLHYFVSTSLTHRERCRTLLVCIITPQIVQSHPMALGFCMRKSQEHLNSDQPYLKTSPSATYIIIAQQTPVELPSLQKRNPGCHP